MSELTPASAAQLIEQFGDDDGRLTDALAALAVSNGATPLDVTTVRDLARQHRPDPAILLADANRRLALDASPITEFRRVNSTPPEWLIIGRYGPARLTTRQLGEQRYAAAAILDATGLVPVTLPATGWRQVQRELVGAAVEVEPAADETDAGLAVDWLTSYLDDFKPEQQEDASEAWQLGAPYRDGADVIVFGPQLRQWIEVHRERVSRPDLGRILRAGGCTPERVHVTNPDGQRTTRSAWRVPPEVTDG